MTGRLVITIWFFYSLPFTNTLFAQLNPNYITHYPELSGTEIFDVMPDRMGNIWIATQSGLVKFDGYEYKRFHPDPNDSTTIGSLLVYSLFEDENGCIWVGCMDFVYMYNPVNKSFKGYPISPYVDFQADARAGVFNISADGQGRIYFGVASTWGIQGTNALFYFDIDHGLMRRFESQDNTELPDVSLSTQDPNGNIWLVTNDGFFRIDYDHKLYRIPPPKGITIEEDEHLTSLASDSSGIIWLMTNKYKLISYYPHLQEIRFWSLTNLVGDNIARSYGGGIEIDVNQNLWIGTEQGLIFFNRHVESFEIFDSGTEGVFLPSNINSLCFDSFENLWIGTVSDGLFKYNEKEVLQSVVYRKDDPTSITSGWVYKIIESSDGLIWMATIGGSAEPGLNVWDPVSGTLTPVPYGTFMPGIFNYLVGEINHDEFLFQTNHGYRLFDALTRSVKETNLYGIADSIEITNLYRDSREDLLFCTNNGLFLKSRENTTVRHYDLSKYHGSTVASNTLTDIFESPRYGLWLLTNDGLFLYNYSTDSITRYGHDKSKGNVLSSPDINSFYEDKEGILWVGTWQGGLCRYNPVTGEIKTYTVSDGLPSMSVQSILADEGNGVLWLSTFEGISRFNIEEDLFTNFSLEEGIQGQLFADASYLKTSGGLFLFGGNNGFNFFNPLDLLRNSPPPKVSLTDFKVANRSALHLIADEVPDQTRGIILEHNENNISLDYVGIQYDGPDRNKYAYFLERYDDSWREVGNQRTAYYYNLPPGEYAFYVKASNSNGVWSEPKTFLTIRINPPWWKTWWAYALYGMCLVACLVFLDRLRRKRLLAKERAAAKEKELEHAREIEKAYHQLKTTQSQLIQSEKMASLGQLTAGIAHEIQNPLNFVNNFSEVNAELIEEIGAAIQKGNYGEVKSIVGDILENEKKIVHHGKRADAIVKSMLQHSRSGSGEKQATDINALADEYLRLAYHGFRAKDKNFNVTMKTEFDPHLERLNIIPQDVGRAILNLITNAFYAVTDASAGSATDALANSAGIQYEPAVSIITKKLGDRVEIRVKDNGNGIPEKILNNIFQPFFTTKPAGEGTGLGLSLSYDIVKAHGGELKVETEQNKGTQMTIILPLAN